MSTKQNQAQTMVTRKEGGLPGRSDVRNGSRSRSVLPSWRFAQRETSGLKYALTPNGYVLLK